MDDCRCWRLGQFRPECATSSYVHHLSKWLKALGITRAANMYDDTLPIVMRTPEEHIQISTSNEIVKTWHRDGLQDPLDIYGRPSVKFMILWSSNSPTQLRGRSEKEYHILFSPYDVILMDNVNMWHRCPPPEEGRWFARLQDPDLTGTVWEYVGRV